MASAIAAMFRKGSAPGRTRVIHARIGGPDASDLVNAAAEAAMARRLDPLAHALYNHHVLKLTGYKYESRRIA